MIDRVRGEPVTLERIGADVGDERGVNRDDGAVAREPDARVVSLLAIVAHAREALAAALDPLDRPSEPVRRGRDQDLLGIDRSLRPEATADIGNDDAHLFDGQAERRGDHVAQGVRALGRRRDDQRAGASVAICEHAARLDRHGAEPGMAETLADDEVRAGHRPLGIAHGSTGHHRRVVGPALVQARRRGERRLGRRQSRQPIVFDRHRVERVRELVGALGHDDGDGLADVANEIPREHRLSPAAALLGADVRGRHVRRDLTQIRCVPGEDHAGQYPRRSGDDLREPGVGLGAPDDAQVERAVAREVVDEAPTARQEALIFLSPRRGADHVDPQSTTRARPSLAQPATC